MSETKQIPAERANGCKFDVVPIGGSFPRGFESLPFTPGHHPAVVRVGGGCAKIDPKIVPLLPDYFVKAFRGANCTVVSGGTFQTTLQKWNKKAKRSVYVPTGFTVTYVPSLLKQHYPIIAASTTPRVDQMVLDANFGGIILNDGMERVDFRQDRAVVVQRDAMEIAPEDQDWVADVLPFLSVVDVWMDKKIPNAWVGLEGGGGTKKELYWFLKHKVPCIFIEGAGREVDVFCKLFRAGDAKCIDRDTGDEMPVPKELVTIVPFLDHEALNKALIDHKIILPAC